MLPKAGTGPQHDHLLGLPVEGHPAIAQAKIHQAPSGEELDAGGM